MDSVSAILKDGRPLLVPNDVDYMETLESRFLSFYDIAMMNKHYRCFGKFSEIAEVILEKIGVRNPRHCNDCLCPLGYGGRFYTERVGQKSFLVEFFMQAKTNLFHSPSNTQLEVRVAGLNGTYPNDGCTCAGVELKMRRDPRLTGRRLCSTKFVGRSWVSKTN
ncbi:hypothetical protein Q1695_014207 [Nippostrongylus brasiliensis]|nr:hypothetical protein Q1695_014207 [Nippostrongylus brasiliensis]